MRQCYTSCQSVVDLFIKNCLLSLIQFALIFLDGIAPFKNRRRKISSSALNDNIQSLRQKCRAEVCYTILICYLTPFYFKTNGLSLSQHLQKLVKRFQRVFFPLRLTVSDPVFPLESDSSSSSMFTQFEPLSHSFMINNISNLIAMSLTSDVILAKLYRELIDLLVQVFYQ